MKATETNLKDCWVIEPDIFEDERGYFFEGFNELKFKKLTGINFNVKQLNQSRSTKGVLRGLHFQDNPKAQSKLISCTEGEIIDVAVDLRKHSPSFKKHFLIRLSDENKRQLFVPKGFAHGFLVLSDYARIMYLVDEFYSSEHDNGISFNDPEIGITWSLPKEEIILSAKDSALKNLKDTKINF